MNQEYYKTFAFIGWILLVCSVIQIIFFPIFIVPLPIFFIPTALFFLIATLIKKAETAFPSYLNPEKESFLFNLKLVSYVLYIVAALPLIWGTYRLITLGTPPSFWGSLAGIAGFGLTVIFVLLLFLSACLMRLLNYGNKKVHTYTLGPEAYSNAYEDAAFYEQADDSRDKTK